MSNIYIQEPPTSGKVLLQTTVGDIDIELWSREASKACRNFIQLCLEKYYDATIFHRVIKGFIAQGGDPNGNGTGGESVYGAPFKDEFHSRLRFVRRGLVAMANAGKDDNGSQFFFTLGPCPELQNKHTIFGKVTGDTLYNMLKLEDCLVEKDDRPLYPHKIINTKVLLNPFTDITPRLKDTTSITVPIPSCPKLKVKKNFQLLSFGEEAEEEEVETNSVAQKFRGKGKSSHDLANDPHLSSISASSLYDDTQEKTPTLETIRTKLKIDHVKQESSATSHATEEPHQLEAVSKSDPGRESIQMQIKKLTQELKRKKTSKDERDSSDSCVSEKGIEINDNVSNPLLQEYHQNAIVYGEKTKLIPRDKSERDKKTIELLSQFETKLRNARFKDNEEIFSEEDGSHKEKKIEWLSHQLKFNETNLVLAKDANLPSEDRYDITDPRNPMNKRRRTEKEGKKE